MSQCRSINIEPSWWHPHDHADSTVKRVSLVLPFFSHQPRPLRHPDLLRGCRLSKCWTANFCVQYYQFPSLGYSHGLGLLRDFGSNFMTPIGNIKPDIFVGQLVFASCPSFFSEFPLTTGSPWGHPSSSLKRFFHILTSRRSKTFPSHPLSDFS